MGVRVEAKNLTKAYRAGQVEFIALRGLNLTVAPGEVISIMGPSGCGKTTLLNLIGGMDRPTAGYVTINDLKVTDSDDRDLDEYRLKGVGYIFQFFNLLPSLTASENVELPMVLARLSRDHRRKRAKELLNMVGLEQKTSQRPEELSGGEQQRVAIACALANDPPLLLADEPTGELDRETAKGVISTLVRVSKEFGKTVICVTHDPYIARNTNKILSMRDGLITGEYRPVQITDFESDITKSYTEQVQARIIALEDEAIVLEAAFKAGKVSSVDYNEKFNTIQSTLKFLREEEKRHGL